MHNLAKKVEPAEVFEDVGTVVEAEGGTFRVRAGSGMLRAARAVSCLVAPEKGDFVLLSCVGPEAFVLAILKRENHERTELSVAGDLRIKAVGGKLDLTADEGIDVSTKKDVSVAGTGVRVVAVEGSIVAQKLSLLGEVLQSQMNRVKVVASSVDSVVERVLQRVKRSYRFVEETDQVTAGEIAYTADKNLSMHGENALVTAQELVKVDGSQIHIG